MLLDRRSVCRRSSGLVVVRFRVSWIRKGGRVALCLTRVQLQALFCVLTLLRTMGTRSAVPCIGPSVIRAFVPCCWASRLVLVSLCSVWSIAVWV